MMTVFEANVILIAIAAVIGLLIGWWMFRRRPAATDLKPTPAERVEAPAATVPPPAPVAKVATPSPEPRREGHGLADQGAAATADIAGQVLGVQAHAELPGASGPPDNLQMLKGVGPKLVARLNENGIIRFEQIARLTANEVEMLEDRLGPFKGRITRDRVVEQASYLARGDIEGFEARFGNLGSA